jgi:hypothetical protein
MNGNEDNFDIDIEAFMGLQPLVSDEKLAIVSEERLLDLQARLIDEMTRRYNFVSMVEISSSIMQRLARNSEIPEPLRPRAFLAVAYHQAQDKLEEKNV